MNLHCLECSKLVPQTPGKRAKSYCNNTCRVKYWKKQKEVASGIEKRKPGRPKKDDQLQNTEVLLPGNLGNVKVGGRISEVKSVFKDKKGAVTVTLAPAVESFMGHPIPKGLKGIDLSIWKAEIKEANKK